MSERVCSVISIDEELEEIEYRECIVRCRDCKDWATEARYTGRCCGKSFDPNGFCSWGERKGQ